MRDFVSHAALELMNLLKTSNKIAENWRIFLISELIKLIGLEISGVDVVNLLKLTHDLPAEIFPLLPINVSPSQNQSFQD